MYAEQEEQKGLQPANEITQQPANHDKIDEEVGSNTVEQVDIDDIINRLLSSKREFPTKRIKHLLTHSEIKTVVKAAREVFMEETSLLEISAPITICGDIHGQFNDLLRIFQLGGLPPHTRYLFLGDYVDRGKEGIETVTLLFALKLRYPNCVYILRGNHEAQAITRQYGFYNEVVNRYSAKLWRSFINTFNYLPLSALISDKILCMHGGISPNLRTLKDINSITRPSDVPEGGLLCDLLWSDPSQLPGWQQSERRVSYTFGPDVSRLMLESNNLDLIVRAHQVVEDGYEFTHKRRVVTVFSAPNYCGEFDNCGAIMTVSDNLMCEMKILRPAFTPERSRTVRPLANNMI